MGNKKERVTRADVAALAGVSETIVSYVINNNRYVAKDKRERVEEAVRVLNYQPNNVARALKGKPSNQILFIADHITNEYFANIVNEMDQYAYDAGYLISLCGNRNTKEFASQVISRQYDGIIISSGSFSPEYVEEFTRAGIPVVVFRRWKTQEYSGRVALLGTGLYQGARKAIRHLLDCGCRNIVFADRISKNGHPSKPDDLRLQGVIDELEANGILLTEDYMICGCHSEEELAEVMKQKLQSGMKIDGIFGKDDYIAHTAMQAAIQSGYRVPEDIKVVGFDDSSISRFCSPKMTTIQMDQKHIAKTAIDMIVAMVAGEQPESVEYDSILIKRESTRTE